LVRRRSYSEPPTEAPGKRRTSGGVRHEATERLIIRSEGVEIGGWTLNLSRGGVRAVLEEAVELGHEYTVVVGPESDDPPRIHQSRVVWLQEEQDGQIAGIEFLDGQGGVPKPDDSDSD